MAKNEIVKVDESALAEVDEQMELVDMGGSGGGGLFDLPQLVAQWKKSGQFAQRLGGGDFEVIREGEVGEIIVLGAPFTDRSMFDGKLNDGRGGSICRAINGVISPRSPDPQSETGCADCKYNQWNEDSPTPAKFVKVMPDGKTLGCREKLLVPCLWITNRNDPEEPVVPCIFTLTPTGLGLWRQYVNKFQKSGAFKKNVSKGKFWQQVTAVTLEKRTGDGNTWAVPSFESMGLYSNPEVLHPRIYEMAVMAQRHWLSKVEEYTRAMHSRDTEDIIQVDKKEPVAAQQDGDDSLPF